MMKFNRILIFLFVVSCCWGAKKVKHLIRIEKLDNCADRMAKGEEFMKIYNTLQNMTYFTYKMQTYVNGQMVLRNSAQHIPSDVLVKRCQTKVTSNCEHFLRVRIPDLCKNFVEKDHFYTPFVQSFHPTIRCPLKKGTVYTLKNSTIDVEKFLQVLNTVPGIFETYWLLRFICKYDNVEKFCMDLLFKIYELKS